MMALMRDWAFLMFAISNFLTSLGYPIPYSFATVSRNLVSVRIALASLYVIRQTEPINGRLVSVTHS